MVKKTVVNVLGGLNFENLTLVPICLELFSLKNGKILQFKRYILLRFNWIKQ